MLATNISRFGHVLERRGLLVRCENSATPNVQSATPRTKGLNLIANRRQLVFSGMVGAACACCPPMPAQGAQWSYDCPGPDGWEGTCKTGVSQSPIDIPISTLENIVSVSYPEMVRATVINNGHGSPQVNFPEDSGCEAVIDGETYRLLQIHFHSPSEHTFNGKHTLMEAHLVHKSVRTGDLAVLGTLIQAGADKPNACLADALDYAPKVTGVDVPIRGIMPKLLLPKPRGPDGKRPYATYAGSLTTPPCTEGVRWVVFLDPLEAQASQILTFLTYGGKSGGVDLNARPTQPLGDRELRFFL